MRVVVRVAPRVEDVPPRVVAAAGATGNAIAGVAAVAFLGRVDEVDVDRRGDRVECQTRVAERVVAVEGGEDGQAVPEGDLLDRRAEGWWEGGEHRPEAVAAAYCYST